MDYAVTIGIDAEDAEQALAMKGMLKEALAKFPWAHAKGLFLRVSQ